MHFARFSLILFILTFVSHRLRAQTYEEQWEKYSVEIKKADNYDSVFFDLVKKRDSALVGFKAPNFITQSISGKAIELSKLKGRVVVLNFWYTACQPCIEEMPLLNSLVAHFKGKPISFISFASENADKLGVFFKNHTFNFTHVANGFKIHREIFKLLSVWPYTIIINKDGKIAKLVLGQIHEEELKGYIQLLENLVKTTYKRG